MITCEKAAFGSGSEQTGKGGKGGEGGGGDTPNHFSQSAFRASVGKSSIMGLPNANVSCF